MILTLVKSVKLAPAALGECCHGHSGPKPTHFSASFRHVFTDMFREFMRL